MYQSKIFWPLMSVGTLLVGFAAGFALRDDNQSVDENNIELNQSVESIETLSSVQPTINEQADRPTANQQAVLINQLKGQVDKLSKKLAESERQNKQLRENNDLLAANNDSYQNELDNISSQQSNRRNSNNGSPTNVNEQNFSEEPYLTKSELSQILSDEHSKFYNKKHRSLVKKVNEFKVQERDENWAYEMELKINDFVINHQFGDRVQTQVNCRSDRCLVQIRELEGGAWEAVSNEMYEQHWWPFNSTSSGSTSNNGNSINLTIYAMVGKRK